MDPKKQFQEETIQRIEKQGSLADLKNSTSRFMNDSVKSGYSYNFTWMGRPIIQYPQDIVAMQELIWDIKPDLIIETGVAHGGSLIFYSSILELIGKGQVLGIDIDIRKHNRIEIENHPMFKRIKMIEGSSISADTLKQVEEIAVGMNVVMVLLDSNHTHEHVLEELKLYSKFVSVNSYCVVFDTIVEDVEKGNYNNRPWDVGNNPKTAVFEFLKTNSNFEIDKAIDNKLLISVAPGGYLKRVK
jgi:cephalosporin hydroxylase